MQVDINCLFWLQLTLDVKSCSWRTLRMCMHHHPSKRGVRFDGNRVKLGDVIQPGDRFACLITDTWKEAPHPGAEHLNPRNYFVRPAPREIKKVVAAAA